MSICGPIIGIPKDCGDNNLGAIKRAVIGSFEDVISITLVAPATPADDGVVDTITRTVGTQFEDFPLVKDTSSIGQDWSGDLVADTHSYSQNIVLGFRRIDLRKRNAIMLLAAGRRDLIAAVQDNNDQYWLLGTDQGLRLTENAATTGTTRASGQQTPVTLSSENERYQWLQITEAQFLALLITAV